MTVALPPLHERFCHEYLVDLNGSAAYRRVYPKVKSEKTARTNAARLLANAGVAARVAELQRERLARSDLSAERVLRELSLVAFQRHSQIYRPDATLKSPGEWDEATDATISAIETEEDYTGEEQESQPHGGTLTRNRGTVLATRTHKVKRWDKLKALELLCKHFGLLKEDAPHPDRPTFDLSGLTDAEKATLLAGLRRTLKPSPT